MKYVLFLLMFFCACTHRPGYHNVAEAVIKLSSPEGSGTGFEVIAPSGKHYTVTNRHVCKIASSAEVSFSTFNRVIPLRVVEISESTDLCLLEPVNSLPALSVSRHDILPGEPVDIYGYGLGLPLQHTAGWFVGQLPMSVLGVEHPELSTAHILPGNSGSPVLNEDGQVIGVVFASGAGIGFRAVSVPLRDLTEFLAPY